MKFHADQQPCAICSKSDSTAVCYGCQQVFCMRHFVKHRAHLSQQMRHFHGKRDVFQQDLMRDTFEHPLLASIYAWERKSIFRVQEIADKARQDLQQWLDRTKAQVQTSLNHISDQAQSSEKSNNYTELDFARWNKQLQELRDLLEKPKSVSVVEDEKPWSVIRTIKVIDKQSYGSSVLELVKSELSSCTPSVATEALPEHFVVMFGPCKLSEDDRVLTHSNYRAGLAQATGTHHYSVGAHSISFLVENKGMKNLFIGIVSSSHRVISPTFEYSVHGWWNLDHTLENGQSKGGENKESIRAGDRVTLTIDCDRQHIQLEHHRTERIMSIPIKLDVCPFPWRMLVRLLATRDCLRILD